MIVRLEADGAVVQTTLDRARLRTALLQTGTGSVPDESAADVVLDVAVLRTRAALVATVEVCA